MAWDKCEGTKLVVECLLKPGMPELAQHAGDWADLTQETLAAEIQQTFLKKEIQTLQDVFQEVNNSGKLQDMLTEIKVEPDTCRYTFLGFAPDVLQDYQQCAYLVNEVETELKRKRESINESVRIELFRSVFLRAVGFQAAVKARYPQLNVTVGDNEITFHGLPADIKSTKLIMYEEFLNKQVTLEYELPPQVLKLLNTKPMQGVIHEQFKKANILVAWDAEGSYLKVSGLSQRDVGKGLDILEKAIVQIPVLPDHGESNYHEVLTLAKWQEKKQQLESQYDGFLAISKSDGDLVITCVAGICGVVKEEIYGFLTDNVILEQVVRVEAEMADVVDKLCKDGIRKIVEEWQSCHCDITLSDDPDRPGFVVKATKPGMTNIVRDVEAQIAKLESQVHVIEAGGRAKFFRSSHGQTNLENIALRHNAVVRPVAMFSQDALELTATNHQVSPYIRQQTITVGTNFIFFTTSRRSNSVPDSGLHFSKILQSKFQFICK